MSLTPNFGFNIPDSTDIVNLLTQCYPNFTIADTALQAIKQQGISQATESKSGTVHNIVRIDSDCSVFWFTATSNFTTGDTFTVDGSPVTGVKVSGAGLETGDFVINSNVPCIVKGSVLTVLAGGGSSTVIAQDVTYDNTVSGLTATDVQDAIDELKTDIPANASALSYSNTVSGLIATNVQDAIDEIVAEMPASGSVTVTADGVKTYKQMLDSLWASADTTKIGPNSKILEGDNTYDAIYSLSQKTSSNEFIFARPAVSSANTVITALSLASATSARYNSVNGNITDNSNSVMPSGQHYTLQY